jgi:hypothetical protein
LRLLHLQKNHMAHVLFDRRVARRVVLSSLADDRVGRPRPAKTGCGERRRGHPGCRQSALNRHNGFDLNHELRFHERLTTNSVLGG